MIVLVCSVRQKKERATCTYLDIEAARRLAEHTGGEDVKKRRANGSKPQHNKKKRKEKRKVAMGDRAQGEREKMGVFVVIPSKTLFFFISER